MHKKIILRLGSVLAATLAVAICAPGSITVSRAQTDAEESPKEEAQARAYSDRGADNCLKCHDEDSEYPVLPIFKTKHAQPADERTPFAQLQCETCHGPVGEHGVKKVKKGEERQLMLYFGAKRPADPREENDICLDCHRDRHRMAWSGSVHEAADVACTSCHKIHAVRDQALLRREQPNVCYACHQQTRASFFRPSVHPVRFGQLACSDCHNTHSSIARGLLAKPNLNQTCYGCHAEKRGPFLWEHAPVPEDCALCHVPHGSVHRGLLKQRPPLLCQQCHSQRGHPTVSHTPSGLPSGTASGFLLGSSCLNCHAQVHGSNHPSGVKLMR